MPPTERAALSTPSPSGPGVEHVAGEARQERLVREAQHLGAGGEHHQDQQHAIAVHRVDEARDALPHRIGAPDGAAGVTARAGSIARPPAR